jgi:hypothetical protein
MSLKTLENVTEIDGFTIHREGVDDFKNRFISINDKENTITFKIQNGPIKETGFSGVQVDTLIAAAQLILEGLNKNFPCRENSIAITKLTESRMWLEQRKRDREQRKVEGYNKA